MAWIEVHQELLHHPKNIALATELRLPEYATVGLLVGIWTWALQYAPEGVIPADREVVVCRYIGWRKGGAELFETLRACGWMEGEHVHDWMDYAGRLVRNRRANAERMRVARASDVRDTSDARADRPPPHVLGDSTVPDLTEPNRTGQNQTLGPSPSANGRMRDRKLSDEEQAGRIALKDVLVEVCRWDPESMTRDAWGEVEQAAKQLQAARATPPLVRGFREQWDLTYPTVGPLRPQVIVNHWPEYMGGELKREEPTRARR